MARRHYLVSYDITDDKRRTKVFRTLNDYGDRAQYSVFFCELSSTELAMLTSLLKQCIKPTEDQVMILDLGKAEHELTSRLECIGVRYDPPCRVIVV